MRKLSVLLGTLVTCMCVGCSEDPNEFYISKTISTLKETTQLIDQVAKTASDAAAQAKKDAKPLAVDKFTKAMADADEIKKKAQNLQQIKAQTELRKESITTEQRDEYAKKHKAAFQAAMADVDAAQKRLDAALREADVIAEGTTDASEKAKAVTALGKLRDKLKEAQDEFEVLTKRQT